MNIDIGKREEWETEIPIKNNGGTLIIWVGHIRGDYYGNMSFRNCDNQLFELHKGFHIREKWFEWMLGLPLGWNKIIDSRIYFSRNEANKNISPVDGERIK